MRAVLLIAHGSRKPEAKEEILNLAGKLSSMLAEQYDMVSSAFLERAAPAAVDKIQDLIDKGATDILIIPYLLATGRHVAMDIPDMVAAFQKKYPHLTIQVLPHIGSSEEMPGLIKKHVEAGIQLDT